jgi:hypothetical protein
MRKPSQGQRQRRESKRQTAEPERGPWWMFHQTDPVAGFTGWLVVATVLLGFIALCQVWAFIQSERAFLTIGAMSFSKGHLVANEPAVITYTIKNGGKGTAFIEKFSQTTMIAVSDPLPPTPVYRETPFPGLIGPVIGGGVKTGRAGLGTPNGVSLLVFDTLDIDRLKTGKAKIYVFGYIRYTDDFSFFGRSRVTGFCYLYNPEGVPSESVFDDCKEPAYTYAH